MERSLANIPCIILAGGKGTRLQSVLPDLPKPMAPIGNKPFIHLLLDKLHTHGISQFILAVGYKKESIMNYFKTLSLPYSISYSIEETALGTGGAITKAIRTTPSNHAFVINGDTLFDIDLYAFYTQSISCNSECSLALYRMVKGNRFGEVEVENKKIITFSEKKEVNNSLINGGVYLLDVSKFKQRRMPTVFAFETDYLEKFVGENQFSGIEMNGYFLDIGIPDDYKKAQDELTS